jgi:large subunit ribosomal protein L47
LKGDFLDQPFTRDFSTNEETTSLHISLTLPSTAFTSPPQRPTFDPSLHHDLPMLRSAFNSAVKRSTSSITTQAPFQSTFRSARTKYTPHPFMEFFSNVRFPRTGRAWSVQECRIKSQHDLEKLWFVLLKERNALSTYQHYCAQNKTKMKGGDRIAKCKASMKSILHVISERRHAYKEVTKDKRFLEDRKAKRKARALDSFEARLISLRNRTTPNQLKHVTYQDKTWRRKTMGQGSAVSHYQAAV